MRVFLALCAGLGLGWAACQYWTTGTVTLAGQQPAPADAAPAPEPNAVNGLRIAFCATQPASGRDVAALDALNTAVARIPGIELICDSQAETAVEQSEWLTDVMSRHPDAVVVRPCAADPTRLQVVADQILAAAIPLITIEHDVGAPVTSHIRIDHRGVGAHAARFLARRLRNSDALVLEIAGPRGLPPVHRRSQGFRSTLRRLCPNARLVTAETPDLLAETALPLARELLTLHPDVAAVFSHDDDLSVGIVQALWEAQRDARTVLVSVGGSEWALRQLLRMDSPVAATFLCSIDLESDAIRLAQLAATGRALAELNQTSIPRQIVLRAPIVTTKNAKRSLEQAY